MKAKDLANEIANSVHDKTGTTTMEQALLVGLEKLMVEFRPRLLGKTGTGELAVLREMFTFWKATAEQLITDERWPDHMPGYRDRARTYVVSALPTFLHLHNPAHFLLMYNSNAFLGWTPTPEQKLRINQLSWSHSNKPMLNRGLAPNHLRARR